MANFTGTTHRKLPQRLGVCSWSLQPNNPAELIQRLQATGISQIQLALDPILHNPTLWGDTPRLLAQNGVRVLSGMFGCAGEDYTSLETIRLTGGIAPDATWDINRQHMKQAAVLARNLGLGLVTFHAGFVPHEPSSPSYAKLLDRLTQAAGIFSREGVELGLETGQETASALAELLRRLNQPGLRVNFDPANMILYGKGDPVEAVGVLGPWISQVHIKDAVQTAVTGTWGQEVPAGEGQVNWAAFFQALEDQRYTGNLIIEREAGVRRVEDIRAAAAMIQRHYPEE